MESIKNFFSSFKSCETRKNEFLSEFMKKRNVLEEIIEEDMIDGKPYIRLDYTLYSPKKGFVESIRFYEIDNELKRKYFQTCDGEISGGNIMGSYSIELDYAPYKDRVSHLGPYF